MREILFKGKRIDSGEWVEGYVFSTLDHTYIAYAGQFDDDLFFGSSNIFVKVDPETICQYTGLKDKNGNQIWENDILHVVEKMGNDVYHNGNLVSSPRWINELNFKVEFTPGGLMNTQRFANALQIECEVIGNIFDNPELLKGE